MSEFENFLQPGKKGYLIGIGGVSMAPLAEILAGMGLSISGSDMQESEKVAELRERGIRVNIGHRAENILPEYDFVVRTAAVHDENPEIVAARERSIPVFERAQAWGALMRGYKNALCIAGTHGKTTTTSMCTHILMAAEKDPTVMIGGTLPLLHAGHRVGRGDTIVMESCEYYDSFLSFHPTIAVLLDVEADHLDYFSDLAAVKRSFRRFAELVPADGWILQPMTVTFYEGESVFNVLQRTCKQQKIHMEFSNTPIYNSAYIEGIGNLYEFDCGEVSGWMYKVNDWFPNYGCSRYQLQNGDVVEWEYTCELGKDIGGGYAAGSTE